MFCFIRDGVTFIVAAIKAFSANSVISLFPVSLPTGFSSGYKFYFFCFFTGLVGFDWMLVIVNVPMPSVWILLSFFKDWCICCSRQLLYLLVNLLILRIVFKPY